MLPQQRLNGEPEKVQVKRASPKDMRAKFLPCLRVARLASAAAAPAAAFSAASLASLQCVPDTPGVNLRKFQRLSLQALTHDGRSATTAHRDPHQCPPVHAGLQVVKWVPQHLGTQQHGRVLWSVVLPCLQLIEARQVVDGVT